MLPTLSLSRLWLTLSALNAGVLIAVVAVALWWPQAVVAALLILTATVLCSSWLAARALAVQQKVVQQVWGIAQQRFSTLQKAETAVSTLPVVIEAYEAALNQAQHERTRFDRFFRASTFLDQESGFGNRLFFDRRLEAALKDADAGPGGSVFLLQLRELDVIQAELGDEAVQEVLLQLSQVLNSMLSAYDESVVARRAELDFAILLPNLVGHDAEKLAAKLIRRLHSVPLPANVEREHFFHVGVVQYRKGEEPFQVLSEADMALRAAQLQGPSSWFMYDRGEVSELFSLGAVRWRSMLETAIAQQRFVLFMQAALTADKQKIHHQEVLLRMRDPKGQLICANVFLPMASKCGLLKQLDRLALEKLIRLMEYEPRHGGDCSVNLSPESLLDPSFVDWLVQLLGEHRQAAARIIIELAEFQVARSADALIGPLQRLKQQGCRLLVDKVGQTVVGSSYVVQLDIDYLKLHQSVVRNVAKRPENQLFVRSLLGSISHTETKIFALGIETEQEWKTLRGLGVYGVQGHLISESTEVVADMISSTSR